MIDNRPERAAAAAATAERMATDHRAVARFLREINVNILYVIPLLVCAARGDRSSVNHWREDGRRESLLYPGTWIGRDRPGNYFFGRVEKGKIEFFTLPKHTRLDSTC